MADQEGFGEAFDRAAEADAGLRRRRGLEQGERATGAEILRRLHRLDSTERKDPALDGLAAAAARGDAAARERLVAGLLPLVRRTARRYAGPDLDTADLIQEGVLGVLRALQRFDADRGVPFTAYAGWWIRQAMQQAVAEQSRAVRLPTHVLWDIH